MIQFKEHKLNAELSVFFFLYIPGHAGRHKADSVRSKSSCPHHRQQPWSGQSWNQTRHQTSCCLQDSRWKNWPSHQTCQQRKQSHLNREFSFNQCIKKSKEICNNVKPYLTESEFRDGKRLIFIHDNIWNNSFHFFFMSGYFRYAI